MLPLDGVRVVDATHTLPGAYSTLLLADMGAEIVKVERPETGDPARHRPPFQEGRSVAFDFRNRNKQSVSIDLKTDAGREVFLELAATADVVVESFRPGVVERLGVDYETVRELDDDIVYCSITGYGQTGPYAQKAGHDITYIAIAGMLGVNTDPDEEPSLPGYPVADFAGGLTAAFTISSVLSGVRAGAGGDYIDVSMTDVVATFSMAFAQRYFEGADHRVTDTVLGGNHPAYRPYETSDGTYLVVAALEPHFWDNFSTALDRPELREEFDPTPGSMSALEWEAAVDIVRETLRSRPRAEWLARFDEHDVPAAPVKAYHEIFDDDHLAARGLFDMQNHVIGPPFVLDSGDEREPTAAPKLGADTETVLTELGYSSAEVSRLLDDGVLHRE